MDYNGIDNLLNTIENMEVLINGIKKDDDTITVTGIDWFKFNNIITNNLYASGNHWIGMGVNSEHLKVCRRDGAMWHLYRQEGTIYKYYKFLKIRWEGYTYYSSSSAEYALKYELLLINNGDMFLNVIQTPTNSSYIGTSSITCNGLTINLNIPVNSAPQIAFYHLDNVGLTWDIKYEKVVVLPPYDRKYLVSDGEEKYYTVAEGALSEVQITALTAQSFLDHGVDVKPGGDMLISLVEPKLLFWQNSQNELPVITANVTATPPQQTLYTRDQDMSDSSITGIINMVVDAGAETKFLFSFDSGGTWKIFDATGGQWVEALEGMTKTQVEAVTEAQWKLVPNAGKYQIKFLLETAEDFMDSVVINYRNEESI